MEPQPSCLREVEAVGVAAQAALSWRGPALHIPVPVAGVVGGLAWGCRGGVLVADVYPM